MGTIFFTAKSSSMNWSFVFLAQHEDPEGGSSCAASYHLKNRLGKRFGKNPKCRNGKIREKKNVSCATFWRTSMGRRVYPA
jgi:hypothetical protein